MPKVAMVAYDILSLLSSVIKENGELKINYLLNENGYIGLRGLFRLKSNGIVERTFQIKTIENSKFKTYKKPRSFLKINCNLKIVETILLSTKRPFKVRTNLPFLNIKNLFFSKILIFLWSIYLLKLFLVTFLNLTHANAF